MYDAVGRRGFRWVVAPAGAVAGRPAAGVARRAAHARRQTGRGVRERVVWGRVSASGRCGGKRGSSGKRAASVSGRHDALYLIDCKNGKKVASFFDMQPFSARRSRMAPFAPRGGGFIGFHTGPVSQTPAPVSRRRAGRATARRGRHENRENGQP